MLIERKIDRGELAGTSTAESAELRAAKLRSAELDAELATGKRARVHEGEISTELYKHILTENLATYPARASWTPATTCRRAARSR